MEGRVAEVRRRYGLRDDAPPSAPAGRFKDRFLRNDRGLGRLAVAAIEQSSDLQTDGFHPRFYHGEVGRWLRWSVPGPASTLFLPLALAGNRRLQCEIVFALTERIRDELRVRVAGTELAVGRSFQRLADGTWITVLEAVIPASLLDPRWYLHEITFLVPETLPISAYALYAWDASIGAFALGRIHVY